MKKLLIIGVSGLTGYNLAKLSSNQYQVFGTYNKRPIDIKDCEISLLDKTNKEHTNSLIKKIEPNIIIDCSALHNVDYCEFHQEQSWKVNVEAPKYIAELCNEINARFIYISTDYVFDGTNKIYNESSTPNPLNYYGMCKLKAEQEIAKFSRNYAIARSSLLFGWNTHELRGQKSSSEKSINFVVWALDKLRNEENLNIVTDQYSTPTLANNLAEYLLALANSNINGIFHTAGKECINRYDFTLKITEVFKLKKELIHPVISEIFKQVAKRPMRCCLNSEKAQNLLKVKPMSIYEALLKMKEQESNP